MEVLWSEKLEVHGVMFSGLYLSLLIAIALVAMVESQSRQSQATLNHFVQPLSYIQPPSSLLKRTKATQSTSARLELNTSVMNVDNGQYHDRDAAVPRVPSGG